MRKDSESIAAGGAAEAQSAFQKDDGRQEPPC